jgi:allantoinase
VRGEELHSKAQWTPFEGATFRGRVMRTFVRGRLVYDADAGVLGEPGWGVFVPRGAASSSPTA